MKKPPALTEKEKTRLLIESRNLTPYVARRYFHRFPFSGFTEADMFQIGNLGMVEALNHWKPLLGDFPPYACYWIRHMLSAALTEYSNFIHVPNKTRQHVVLVREYSQKNSISPMDMNPKDVLVQQKTGLNARQLRLARHALTLNLSVLSCDGDGIDKSAIASDILPSTQTLWNDSGDSDNPERIYLEKQIREQLRQLFASVLVNGQAPLKPKEREILRLVFLEGYNMAEVGRAFGCTRANIEASVKKALPRIRHFFEDFH